MSATAVLIIDDDPRNVFALNAVLHAKGYKTYAAHSAAEGFSKLEQHPDIGTVLMDMMMPEMDGYEAIGLIRNNTNYKNMPVIAVTAQAMIGDRERCIMAGANDYISKPVDIDILVRLLQSYQ